MSKSTVSATYVGSVTEAFLDIVQISPDELSSPGNGALLRCPHPSGPATLILIRAPDQFGAPGLLQLFYPTGDTYAQKVAGTYARIFSLRPPEGPTEPLPHEWEVFVARIKRKYATLH